MNSNNNWGSDMQYIILERTTLNEWAYLQQLLFDFALTASHSPTHSRRSMIENHISQITGGCVRIWWEPYIVGSAGVDSRLFEMRYKQIHFGMLEFTSGYLDSKLMPGIAQQFAQLCALILALVEYEEFLQHQLAQLSPSIVDKQMRSLTARERDVLHGLLRGESEIEMANRLCIETTTVHTHVQRLYRRLEVHNPWEAKLRSFALRLVDWLDLPSLRNG
jgi:DNA-binding CsgD family transcriptional regulator